MSYGVLTLSTRTTFLDNVLYLEDSTEQVPSPSQVQDRFALKVLSSSKPDGPNVKELLSLQLLGLSFAAAHSVAAY